MKTDTATDMKRSPWPKGNKLTYSQLSRKRSPSGIEKGVR